MSHHPHHSYMYSTSSILVHSRTVNMKMVPFVTFADKPAVHSAILGEQTR